MPRPRRYDAAVRERLLAVAAKISTEEGPAALSARRLAGDSGTTTAAIYTLFGGMDALRAALTAQTLAHLAEAQQAAGTQDSPVGQVRQLARAYRGWVLSHPHEYGSILTPTLGMALRRNGSSDMVVPLSAQVAPDPFLRSVEDGWYAALTPMVNAMTQGLRAGVFKGKEDQAGSMALSLLAALHGHLSLELVDAVTPTLRHFSVNLSTDQQFEDFLARQITGLMHEPTAPRD